MIDKEKWNTMSDDEKMQMCKSLKTGAKVNNITKDDWKLMFDFLMDQLGQ